MQHMKESRNPDAIRGWLNARVDEGFDENTIKTMLCMTSEQLSEVFFLSFHSVLPLKSNRLQPKSKLYPSPSS